MGVKEALNAKLPRQALKAMNSAYFYRKLRGHIFSKVYKED